MAEVTTLTAPIPTYVLRDGNAEVQIAPARGGLVTRFTVGGVPVLFMDDASLYDLSKNVRGGVPILFPCGGPLKDNTFTHGGKAYEMKQHGFARNEAWEVSRHDAENSARLTLTLRSSAATYERFPFDFVVEYTFTLRGASLRIDQRYRNLSASPMPLHAGFHPYFFVPEAEKAKTYVDTHATRAFDNVTKQDIDFSGFDLTQKEVDLHLKDHGSTASFLKRPGGETIAVNGSAEFTHWVVWTLAGKDFVCLEPWTAPGNALNTGERLLWVAPNEARDLWIEIALH